MKQTARPLAKLALFAAVAYALIAWVVPWVIKIGAPWAGAWLARVALG